MQHRPDLLEQLVNDPSFQQWVHQPTPTDRDYWDTWMHKHPEARETVEAAVAIVRGLPANEKPLSSEQIETYWQELQPRLVAVSEKPSSRVFPIWARRMSIAASACLLLAITILIWNQQSDEMLYQTAYGQTQIITLPDSTQVTLNANSTLRIASMENFNEQREAWISGEAFFEVRKKPLATKTGYLPFVVHTDNVDVKVLGTEFNVHDRRGTTTVVLASGQVLLENYAGSQVTLTPPVVMKPDDLVSVSNNASEIQQQTVDSEEYLTWRKNKLAFTDATLREIAQVLADQYGWQLVMEEALYDQRFTGSSPLDQPEVILESLAASFGWNIQKEGDRIYLSVP